MATLTNFAWAVLESCVNKMERLNQPIPANKCDPKVMQELLDAGAVVKKAWGKPRGYMRGQASGLYPTELGRNLLADRKALQQSQAESP